jgi:hypothetical protein
MLPVAKKELMGTARAAMPVSWNTFNLQQQGMIAQQ